MDKYALLLIILLTSCHLKYAEELAEESVAATDNIDHQNVQQENEEENERIDLSVVGNSELESNLGTDVDLEEKANTNVTAADNSTSRARLVCNNTLDVSGQLMPTVHLLNGSQYQIALASEYNLSVVNRTSPSACSITLFFADWCEFSAKAAPHFNALARAFPQLKLYAVDSSRYHGINTNYGVMAVPTLLIFHNSRPLYKYNYTEYSLAEFKEFVTFVTGIEADNDTEVTAEDWIGPVPSVATETNNTYLFLAIIFMLLCAFVEFSKSPLAGQLQAGLRNAWREAEIQHEHND